MNLDTGVSETVRTVLSNPTAAMLIVAFCLYVIRNRREW